MPSAIPAALNTAVGASVTDIWSLIQNGVTAAVPVGLGLLALRIGYRTFKRFAR